MQYKIPIQIENEDVIVAWLSLRQLMIMMIWGGIWYGVFKYTETNIAQWLLGIWLGAPFVLIWIFVALIKVSEMTFLPVTLNFLRLTLNAKSRMWSQWADSYSEMDVGYISPSNIQKETKANKTYGQVQNDEFETNIGKL